jgi:tetratricopeptide (TPR) repeat protein
MKPPEPPKPLTDRERGNACFVKGEYEEALKFYGLALVSGEMIDLDDIDGGDEGATSTNDNATPYSSNVTISEVVEKDAKAILHCNRAACYLKLAQGLWGLKQGELSWEDVEEDIRKDESVKKEGMAYFALAESEGRAAISFDGEYVKGYFRTGQALALQGKLKHALKVAKEGIKVSKDGDR